MQSRGQLCWLPLRLLPRCCARGTVSWVASGLNLCHNFYLCCSSHLQSRGQLCWLPLSVSYCVAVRAGQFR